MRLCIVVSLAMIMVQSYAQTIVGTWQLSDEKTCLQSEFTESDTESDTEKELVKDMQVSSTSAARTLKFDKKGNGEEAILMAGKKKGTDVKSFKYKIAGKDLMLLDSKSGLMTQQWTIDELSQSTLKIHNSIKGCETKAFLRIK